MEDTPKDRTEARRRLDEACTALSQNQAEFKRDCDTLESLLDGPPLPSGVLLQAQHIVRLSAMKNMALVASYLTAVNDIFQKKATEK